MKQCMLCPRACKVDRAAGKRGVCGQNDQVKIARAALHFWEEPCISGKSGSGAVFFSGCPLHCVFCQNAEIANGTIGKEISVERLSEIFYELQNKGANNINLVTPTQFVPQIVRALERARRGGMDLPIVYNTSSYEKVDTIKQLEGLVDIYLPDLKYYSPEIAMRYAKAPDYFATATAAIDEMFRQVGRPEFIYKGGEENVSLTSEQYNLCRENEGEILMRKGVIVRHLLLPTRLADSRKVIRFLHNKYGNAIYISMMSQYTPVEKDLPYKELESRVSKEAYENLIEYAGKLGIQNAFWQDGEVAEESFIPAFDLEGVERVDEVKR